jgi:predicted transcriptional regulator
LKLTSDDETLAENKVLILYILNKIGKPISNDALLNLVLAVTDMNYFYFQQFLLDLLENGYIINYHKDEHSFYEITNFGKETLSLTQDILPGIIKLRVDSNFKNELETFENEHSVIAEYIPRSENDYTVTCKIIDHNDTIFEVKTFAGSGEQAKDIVNNWKHYAEEMYPQILTILTRNGESLSSTEDSKKAD